MITAEPLYKAFPPRRASVLLPASSRHDARAGLSMYAACNTRALVAQRLADWAIRLLGPRAIPGAASPWSPPMGGDAWSELLRHWERTVGPIGAIVVHERRQLARSGFAGLLLRDGTPLAFVKVTPNEETLANERTALELVGAFGPRSFSVPRLRDAGEVGGWHHLTTSPLATGIHRPARSVPLRMIVEEVQAALGPLPRPSDLPAAWRPMHGDLAPWNLRRLANGSLSLLDWEHAGWGPPGADEVFFLATGAALGGRPVERCVHGEAVAHWLQELTRRPHTPGTDRFGRDVMSSLRRLAGNSSGKQG